MRSYCVGLACLALSFFPSPGEAYPGAYVLPEDTYTLYEDELFDDMLTKCPVDEFIYNFNDEAAPVVLEEYKKIKEFWTEGYYSTDAGGWVFPEDNTTVVSAIYYDGASSHQCLMYNRRKGEGEQYVPANCDKSLPFICLCTWEWGTWGEWSDCPYPHDPLEDCLQIRPCYNNETGVPESKTLCYGEETRDCTAHCPLWGEWGPCPIPHDPTDCTHHRDCEDEDGIIVDDRACIDDPTRDCSALCPLWTEWSGDCPVPHDPTSCSEPRTCLDMYGSPVDPLECLGEDSRDCGALCPLWGEWASCPAPHDPASCSQGRPCYDLASNVVDPALCLGDGDRDCSALCPVWGSWDERCSSDRDNVCCVQERDCYASDGTPQYSGLCLGNRDQDCGVCAEWGKWDSSCPVPHDPASCSQSQVCENSDGEVLPDSDCAGEAPTRDCAELCPLWTPWVNPGGAGCGTATRTCEEADGTPAADGACLGEGTDDVCVFLMVFKDALTNALIPGVSLQLTTPAGDVVSLTADGSGRATYPGVVGDTFTLTATKEGFLPMTDNVFTLLDEAAMQQNMFLAPELAAPKTAVGVLSWGAQPCDLDTHVIISDKANLGGQTCHLYFGKKDCTRVTLDVDNTQGGDKGPETITFYDVGTDFYHLIYIYNFSGNGGATISMANTKYTVYTNFGTYYLDIVRDPALTGRYWIIGCISLVDGIQVFKPINRIQSGSPGNAGECDGL